MNLWPWIARCSKKEFNCQSLSCCNTSRPIDPSPFRKLWSLRNDTEIVVHSDNAFATVAYLRITNAILIPKENPNVHLLTVPPLLENEFLSVQDKLQEEMDVNKWPVIDSKNLGLSPVINCSSSRVGNWVSVCNVQRCSLEPQRVMSLEDEVEECFTILQGESVSQATWLLISLIIQNILDDISSLSPTVPISIYSSPLSTYFLALIPSTENTLERVHPRALALLSIFLVLYESD